jgi:cell wall-associated NlpC family hydrolase
MAPSLRTTMRANVTSPPTMGAWRVAAAISVGILIASTLGAPAQAEPDLASARVKARELTAQVKALEIKTEIATEKYNALNDQLQRTVNKLVLAERSLDAAKARSTGTQQVASERVRALYIAGGSAALYATVLDSGSITEVIDRVGAVDALVSGDRVRTEASVRTVSRATQARKQIGKLARQRTKLQQAADRARADVQTLLNARTERLRDANATVLRLAKEYERQQEALAAERARRQLQSLDLLNTGTLNGNEGPMGTPWSAGAILAARSQIGEPYLWGGTGPDAWDCSGLVRWAYTQTGIFLPRTSRQQWNAGAKVALQDLRAGDLLFWAYDTSDPTTIHHVAMYVGGGRMVEAPRTGLDVREIPVYLDGYIGAVRPTRS